VEAFYETVENGQQVSETIDPLFLWGGGGGGVLLFWIDYWTLTSLRAEASPRDYGKEKRYKPVKESLEFKSFSIQSIVAYVN
jgi:hypothetical protein